MERNLCLKNRKKERIKINNINDFKDTLKREEYNINEVDEEKFKEKTAEIFKVDKSLIDSLYIEIRDNDITYRADNAQDFIDYIEKIIVFENNNKKLCENISKIEKINIDRIEYERAHTSQDIDKHVINSIKKIKKYIFRIESEEEKRKLEILEQEIDNNYLYAKDIELLKRMLIIKREDIKEKYNDKTKIKTISIEMPEKINFRYIPVKKGSIEYHEHLRKNIPRLQRLIRSLNKYMIALEGEKITFKIDQSKVLQDSINIAVAVYDNKEFKAISGSNNIIDYCIAPEIESAIFKSYKVNKLGKIGVGYNRVNDSEKKIFEEIHKQIEGNLIKNEGELILYSKWEPCPSCCFVISQFCEKYPNIKVQVKYSKKYGE